MSPDSQVTKTTPVSTEIRILGKSYSIRSEFDQAFMQETANLVDSKIRELVGKAGSLSGEKVAVLAAMNLAGELLQERKDSGTLRQTIQQRTKKILELIKTQL